MKNRTDRLPKLTPRLETVASLVREGARLLDVGTDHAYLPAVLVGHGKCKCALATDLRKGPLAHAAATIAACGLKSKISLVMTDGLTGLSLEEIDDVVLAGMGGKLMLSIIKAAPSLKDPRLHLILQPQTDLPSVRETMAGDGFCLNRELLVREEHRIYHVFSFVYDGVRRSLSLLERQIGNPEADRQLLHAYRQNLKGSLTKQLAGIRKSEQPDVARAEELEKILSLLEAGEM